MCANAIDNNSGSITVSSLSAEKKNHKHLIIHLEEPEIKKLIPENKNNNCREKGICKWMVVTTA